MSEPTSPISAHSGPRITGPSSRTRPAGLLVAVLVGLLGLVGLGGPACGGDTEVVKNLHLRVSSDVPAGGGNLDNLGILLSKGGVRYPVVATEAGFNPPLGQLNPVAGPVLIALDYKGQTFGDGKGVTLQVVGRAGTAVKTRFEGVVDLDRDLIIDVRLLAIPSNCDADGDGFLDCSIAGCCQVGSPFADCNDGDPSISPWAVLPACIPCKTSIDRNCDGTPETCIDNDGDEIADCEEINCGLNDPTVGPGLPEICDGKDNNCDGTIDEGFALDGVAVGQPCMALGECGAGVVECKPGTTDETTCSTGPGGSRTKVAAEICDNKDNDCDGDTDEGFTYDDADLGEACVGRGACGDGIVQCAVFRTDLATCSTNPDGNASQATPEVCDTVDNDCDGETDEGLTRADSDCSRVGICGTNFNQVIATCNDEGEWDCDYSPIAFWQEVETRCDDIDNDCDGDTDEDFAYQGLALGVTCDGVGECGQGVVQCAAGRTDRATCSTNVDGTNSQSTPERCDGLDNDCNGQTDEIFAYLGVSIGGVCDGVGECGIGVVQCAPGRTDLAACSTNPNGGQSQATSEVCDALDNDCDGQTDESFDTTTNTCKKLGVCATGVIATCTADGSWICDYSLVPNYQAVETLCDGLDNDCDGETDEGFSYQGFAVGQTCDGVGACGVGVVQCADTATATCSTNPNGTASQAATEVCDGLDNDCDGGTDEGFTYLGTVIGQSCDGVGECGVGVVQCAVGRTDLATCSTNPNGTNSQAVAEVCDAKDNDCDGDTDEGFGLADSDCKQVGVCAAALGSIVATCLPNGTWSCNYVTVPNYQNNETLCDTLDNDCDGTTDEGYDYLGALVGEDCDGIGACGAGVVQCATPSTATCSTNPNGTNSQATTEVCDGLDNDCDNSTDEGFTYLGTAVGMACDGIGECGAGLVECLTTTTTTCSTNPNGSEPDDVPEVCDALDNDCDSSTDEELTLADSTCTKVGVCALALPNIVATCTVAGTWSCNYSAVPDYENPEVSCDELDNNCNGTADEGFLYQGQAIGANCNGLGQCGPGQVQCSTGVLEVATCSTNPDGDDNNATGEICDGLDNNCDGDTDEGFPDIDDDDIADCVDPCVDIDGDGICVIAGAPPCVGGQTVGCSDNCPTVENPSQADADRDGIGDLCDTCPLGPTPYEVCGDCIDNNCSGGIDEAGCVERRTITIVAKNEPLAAGYPVKLVLDHKTLVDAGFSTEGGDDIRIFYRDPTANCDDANPYECFTELDRVLDPLTAFNTTTTTLWFALQDELDVGEATTAYELYYHVDTIVKPAQDERAVFHFADLFDRADSDTLGMGWSEPNQVASDFAIASNRLAVNYSGNAFMTPVITRTFDPISAAGGHGAYEFRIGLNWARSEEQDWASLVQLGKGSALLGMPENEDHWPNAGVGVSLAHGGGASLGDNVVNTLATVSGVSVDPTFVSRGTFPAGSEAVVGIDFESVGGPTYTITGGDSAETDDASTFATAQTELDTLRIILTDVGNLFTLKAWDYLILRPKVASASDEPDVFLGLKERFGSGQATCQLGTGQFLKYRMNERATNAEASNLIDTSGVGTALGLTREQVVSTTNPNHAQILNHWAVRFSARATAARYRSVIQKNASKLGTNIEGATQLTFELVVDNRDGGTRTGSIDWLALAANSNFLNAFGIGFVDRDTIEARARTTVDVTYRWDVAQLAWAGRITLHLVYDSTAAADNRLRLYYDGALLNPIATTAIAGNAGLDIFTSGGGDGSEARLIIGNSNTTSPIQSPLADVFWFAAYSRALTAADVKHHTRILLKDDDAP